MQHDPDITAYLFEHARDIILVIDAGTWAPRWRHLVRAHAELDEPFTAPGYLVLADNRDDGRCCDSRALGWIDMASIRGEVVVRLGGGDARPGAQPGTGSFQWKP